MLTLCGLQRSSTHDSLALPSDIPYAARLAKQYLAKIAVPETILLSAYR